MQLNKVEQYSGAMFSLKIVIQLTTGRKEQLLFLSLLGLRTHAVNGCQIGKLPSKR